MVLSYYMNTQKQKIDRWPQFLNYSVMVDRFEPIFVKSWVENKRLTDEAQDWLEENVGYTKESSWHKDKWHPAKPKFLVEMVDFAEGRNITKCLMVRFYDEEDAMAFKLTWL